MRGEKKFESNSVDFQEKNDIMILQLDMRGNLSPQKCSDEWHAKFAIIQISISKSPRLSGRELFCIFHPRGRQSGSRFLSSRHFDSLPQNGATILAKKSAFSPVEKDLR
jgi:hypothetical protein